MKILNAFMLEVLKDNRDICQIPDNELNTIICEFIINVHQRNGSEYEPNTVKGIVTSIDRHIRSNNYGNSIKKGDAFNASGLCISICPVVYNLSTLSSVSGWALFG
jgi:hypothetical protein